MWRYLAPAGAFLLLGALFALALLRIQHGDLDVREIKSPLIGKAAPTFTLPLVLEPSQTFDSKSMAGKPYIVNVWGTWCPACREEHESLLQLSRITGVPFIGIDWKDDGPAAQQYLRQLGNPYQTVVADAEGRIAIDWGVYGAPETFLVSHDGKVLAKHAGALTEAVWAEKFAPLLAQQGGAP
jgi:cytochrome c biogenesis protein CcmG/thiol:disulfide interchange protein DsbE